LKIVRVLVAIAPPSAARPRTGSVVGATIEQAPIDRKAPLTPGAAAR